MAGRILLVEDDRSLSTVLQFALKEKGYSVELAVDGEAGLTGLRRGDLNLALLDLNLPRLSGLDILRHWSQWPGDRPAVIVITANGTVESAVEAMKLGAVDYLVKPFSMDELVLRVERAFAGQHLKAENRSLRRELNIVADLKNFVGQSARFRDMLALLRQAADSEATVILTGESGTGKELAARFLHAQSRRADGPFVVVNCAAIPEMLIESELFGHVKGAFTGATGDHVGKFERAGSGTIFFDEIGELKLSLQAKLLRAIQEREVERVGGTKPIPVNVRIVAASNMDLKKAVAAKQFREDLFYRLNVVPVTLPPLRERLDDLPILVAHVLTKLGRPEVSLNPDALAVMKRHRWPGNVRELEHALERGLVLLGSQAVITPELLPDEIRHPAPAATPPAQHGGGVTLPEDGLVLEDVEKNLLEQALSRTEGNQTKAAELLGLTRATLIYRMEKFGLKSKPS